MPRSDITLAYDEAMSICLLLAEAAEEGEAIRSAMARAWSAPVPKISGSS